MPDEPRQIDSQDAAPEPEGGTDDEPIRSLLQRALTERDEPEVDVRSLVQKRLREQSRGKFYGEGWSTSSEPPVARYLVTSLIMFAISVGLYCLLGFTFEGY